MKYLQIKRPAFNPGTEKIEIGDHVKLISEKKIVFSVSEVLDHHLVYNWISESTGVPSTEIPKALLIKETPRSRRPGMTKLPGLL